MVIGVLVGTATVTTQGLTGLLRHDETKSGDSYLAKTGDSQMATSGDFLMATDTHMNLVTEPTMGRSSSSGSAHTSSTGRLIHRRGEAGRAQQSLTRHKRTYTDEGGCIR